MVSKNSEVPKFLTDSPVLRTHVIQLIELFNVAHPLIIQQQLSGVTSYFDMPSLSIAGYENENIPKIHLTAEEPPWDPSKVKYPEHRTICQIIKVASSSLPHQQGDEYLSAQLFFTH